MPNPPSAVSLYVAIYNDEGIYKHWNLFLDGPTTSQKIMLEAMGSSTRYYFQQRIEDARASDILHELIYMCDVPVSTLDAIQLAKSLPIHNEYPGYNCQDFVLELLGELETRGVIGGDDREYQRRKEVVAGKQEGLL
ncbi:uncharacterized protein N7459_000939 [Penicillium hispanicum]|uniref:uncharacterized protein n=1 Tax=Penicillium hispanicum TaxID=1080232 RepID=UPI00253FE1C1|nr:uncharacterized protein N7459_000939 [Penicillium hispanicum]KAJ5594731.1 hypothetical protein N7459_000939 [Penicillium hispanicum]